MLRSMSHTELDTTEQLNGNESSGHSIYSIVTVIYCAIYLKFAKCISYVDLFPTNRKMITM